MDITNKSGNGTWNTEVMARIELKNKARGIIDSEYDSIKNFKADDLWDYLKSLYPEMTRDMSDELFEEIY